MIHINQIIYTIQGEGPHLGYPSLLIRTAKCNLDCHFCDSKFTWKDNDENFGMETIDDVLGVVDKINLFCIENKIDKSNIINLMLTGGEPTLHFNNEMYCSLIGNIISYMGNIRQIEVETNGSAIHFDRCLLLMNGQIHHRVKLHFNFSPKPEGNVQTVKANLKWCVDNCISYILKIVNEPKTLAFFEREILPFINKIDKDRRIYLMPLTIYNQNKVNLNRFFINSYETMKACLQKGYIYSPREHIVLFKDNTDEFRKII